MLVWHPNARPFWHVILAGACPASALRPPPRPPPAHPIATPLPISTLMEQPQRTTSLCPPTSTPHVMSRAAASLTDGPAAATTGGASTGSAATGAMTCVGGGVLLRLGLFACCGHHGRRLHSCWSDERSAGQAIRVGSCTLLILYNSKRVQYQT